ncbi:Uncharacterized protein SCG7086_AC_00300 [Chlamydiales bacterium SCGC AG-110-P3]|nr:Uncharacterized protein SCG7086_AC_00300 [Chlamydiales bacterium SCGC AG-110-P3]
MSGHDFIFTTGEWLGKGQVAFSASEDTIRFNTLWQVVKADGGDISLHHEVELVGVPEKVVNELEVSSVTSSGFAICLSNDMIDKVHGKGIIEDRRIAWEFRGKPGFEGFEIYNLCDDGSYEVHAEYLSSDQFRTIIDGHIWKRKKQ